MALSVRIRDTRDDAFASGLTGAVVLHLAIGGVLIAGAFLHFTSHSHWGDNASTAGSIEATLTSSIPLPNKAKPVDKSVLAPENPTDAPKPPPKEATQPPPKPNELLIKSNTPTKPVKTADVTTPAPPKHPQPTPDTPKANSGEQASQIPQSITQMKNGTASITVQDHTFGDRYAYYIAIIQRVTNESWNAQPVDPRSAHNKSVAVLFDVQRDGTVSNIHIETSSGVQTIDTAAIRAIQRIEGFGPLPSGNSKTIEYKFNYN